jgi:hypothetical protein
VASKGFKYAIPRGSGFQYNRRVAAALIAIPEPTFRDLGGVPHSLDFERLKVPTRATNRHRRGNVIPSGL